MYALVCYIEIRLMHIEKCPVVQLTDYCVFWRLVIVVVMKRRN